MAYQTRILPGTFQPDWFSNCMAWYRADQGITLVSGAVSQWNDLSGNGNTLTQSTSAARPTISTLQGIPALSFNGADSQYLSMSGNASATPLTAFIVCQVSNQSTTQAAVSTIDGLGFVVYTPTSSAVAVRYGATPIAVTANATNPHIYAGIANGTSSNAYLDSVATSGTMGNSDNSGITVGAHQGGSSLFWTGLVAEIIYFSSLLSSTQIATVNNYLGAKYRISL
jgi:hypothetical protein